jgi:hypothetical protein
MRRVSEHSIRSITSELEEKMRLTSRWLCATLCRFSVVALVGLMLLLAPAAGAAVIVNDTWADGGRDNGADALDSNWWTSASSSGIEVSVGSLGMVTGTSGRGIHTVFPTQALSNVGDKLVATYTFTTPATVGTGGTGGFRVGLFDTLGRAALDADVAASSGSPNAVYGWGTGAGGPGTAGLPGYMMDMDVGTGSEDLSFRAHDAGTVNPTGRLLGTTTGFTQISPTGPDGAYAFAPNTTYTGSLTLERLNATEMRIIGTLGSATHTVTDAFDSATVGMLGFWANSNLFGSSGTPGEANNGIDFTNVTIEFIPVPEPAALGVVALSTLLLSLRARRGAVSRK